MLLVELKQDLKKYSLNGKCIIDCEECAPDYCIPDAYNLCNPDMDSDGGCDPHYDNW